MERVEHRVLDPGQALITVDCVPWVRAALQGTPYELAGFWQAPGACALALRRRSEVGGVSMRIAVRAGDDDWQRWQSDFSLYPYVQWAIVGRAIELLETQPVLAVAPDGVRWRAPSV